MALKISQFGWARTPRRKGAGRGGPRNSDNYLRCKIADLNYLFELLREGGGPLTDRSPSCNRTSLRHREVGCEAREVTNNSVG